MMYFKPKKKGVTVDFGRGRRVSLSMTNIIEVDEHKNRASVKARTGAVMVYHGSGIMNIHNKDIMKLIANDNLEMTTTFIWAPLG